MRPLCQRLQRQGFNGDGRTDRASLQPLHVLQFGDGRSVERPLCQRLQRSLCQRLQRQGFNGDGRSTERPYNRYTSHGRLQPLLVYISQ